MQYGYDEAQAVTPQRLAQIKANGGTLVMRYLTGQYATNADEIAMIHAAGLDFLAMFEQAADRAVTGGYAGGFADGLVARTAYQKCGAPAGWAIVFAVDTSVPATEFPAVGAYFDGVLAGLASVYEGKVYGEPALLDYLVNTGRAHGGQFQAAPTAWGPNGAALSPNAGLRQLVGSPVPATDQDQILRTDLGAWPANPTPQPAEDESMYLIVKDPASDAQYVVHPGLKWKRHIISHPALNALIASRNYVQVPLDGGELADIPLYPGSPTPAPAAGAPAAFQAMAGAPAAFQAMAASYAPVDAQVPAPAAVDPSASTFLGLIGTPGQLLEEPAPEAAPPATDPAAESPASETAPDSVTPAAGAETTAAPAPEGESAPAAVVAPVTPADAGVTPVTDAPATAATPAPAEPGDESAVSLVQDPEGFAERVAAHLASMSQA